MRTLILVVLALSIAAPSFAAACECKPMTKQEKAAKIAELKKDKWSRYSKCIRLGGNSDGCLAEHMFYANN